MRKRTFSLIFLAVITTVAVANAQTAQDILAKSKLAMGGDAWDAIRTTHQIGELTTGGLSGQGESWEDNASGRYVTRFQLGPASGAEGFDGKAVWSQDASGEPRLEGAEAARQAAINEAYRNCFAYWFPQRWPARIEYSGEKEDQGKRFHVIRVTPAAGLPSTCGLMPPLA
jgi:hypothetical protein